MRNGGIQRERRNSGGDHRMHGLAARFNFEFHQLFARRSTGSLQLGEFGLLAPAVILNALAVQIDLLLPQGF